MSTKADQKMAFGFGTPWEDQIAFLRNKLNLPTQAWDDIMRAAHDRAFVVAGAQKADLLSDLHAAIIKSAEGGSLAGFRKDFDQIVAKHGWTGWTGEGTKEGEAWRTKIIYTTNMSTSYAAGRYKYLTDPESLQAMPYWRYIHADGILNPRQQHVDWHGLTLPHDHPFWVSHFPPNGFNCHCRITAVSRAEGLRSKAAGLAEPPAGWDKIDTGTLEPNGIGKGWGYAPGASVADEMRAFAAAKAAKLAPELVQALTADVNAALSVPAFHISTIQEIDAFIQGTATAPIVVANIPDDIKTILDTTLDHVLLSKYTADKQAKHPEITAESYAFLQELLNVGERLPSRDKHVVILQHREEPYVAVLKVTKDGDKVFLQSFRRTDAKDILKLRKQGARDG